MDQSGKKSGKYTPALVSVASFIILGVIFLLIFVLVFEFVSKTTPSGDTITPWYVWLFLGLAFLCFFITIIIFIFVPSGYSSDTTKKSKKQTEEQTEQSQPFTIQHISKSNPTLMEPSMSDLDSLSRFN